MQVSHVEKEGGAASNKLEKSRNFEIQHGVTEAVVAVSDPESGKMWLLPPR